jgi:hypothetical protein
MSATERLLALGSLDASHLNCTAPDFAMPIQVACVPRADELHEF